MLFPLVNFDRIELGEANRCLAKWGHRMGPVRRSQQQGICHGLFHRGGLVAVSTAHTLIRQNVAGSKTLHRGNTIELSRLCACRKDLCRVMLRLWREFVFAELPARWAISYQDANLHGGDTYRFDGWVKVAFSHSGFDARCGKQGRDKWVWAWPREAKDHFSAPLRKRKENILTRRP